MPGHEAPLEIFDALRISPMNFSLVCHSWRNAVMSQAGLWCSVEIHFIPSWWNEYLPVLPVSPTSQMLRTWFRNSQNVPLDIRVHGDIPREQVLNFESIVGVLFEHRNRWGMVSFDLFGTMVVASAVDP